MEDATMSESEGLLRFEQSSDEQTLDRTTAQSPQQQEWGLLALLCIFSFLSFFDPSEPFLVTYFTQVKGLTQDQVFDQVFPVWTYSQFVIVLIMGFLSESIPSGYKLIVLLGVFASIVENILMIFGRGLIFMQVVEVVVALKFAGNLVFSSFIYRLVPEDSFQAITSYTRAFFLFGSIASALLGQLLCESEGYPLVYTLYIALGASAVAEFVGLAFPQDISQQRDRLKSQFVSKRFLIATKELWGDVVIAYRAVVLLSIWLAVMLAVHTLVMTYWQSLFASIDDTVNWNGYVYATSYFLAAGATLIPAKIEHLITTRCERWMLSSVPLLGGGLLFFLGFTRSIYQSYVVFIVYHCLFEFALSIACARIASRIPSPSPAIRRFALVFSINNTASLLIQVVLQTIQQSTRVNVTQQFRIFGGSLVVLGTAFVALSIAKHFLHRRRLVMTTNN